ncbi:MAG: MerC domain-containing protein [Pseudomonadota bacterium]
MTARPLQTTAVDMSAIAVSGLCLLHCLALPLIIAFLPTATLWVGSEWVHQGFVVIALLLFLSATLNIQGMKGRAAFVSLAGLGLAFLFAGAFVEALHDFEVQLTVAGAILLAAAHALRWRGHWA